MEGLSFQLKNKTFNSFLPNDGVRDWDVDIYGMQKKLNDSYGYGTYTQVKSPGLVDINRNDVIQPFSGSCDVPSHEVLKSNRGKENNLRNEEESFANKRERKTSVTINGNLVNFPVQTSLHDDLSSHAKIVDIDIGESQQTEECARKTRESIITFDDLVERMNTFEVELASIGNICENENSKRGYNNRQVIDKENITLENELITSAVVSENKKSHETTLTPHLDAVQNYSVNTSSDDQQEKISLGEKYIRRRSLSEGNKFVASGSYFVCLQRRKSHVNFSRSVDDILSNNLYSSENDENEEKESEDSDLSSQEEEEEEEYSQEEEKILINKAKRQRRSFIGKSISVDLLPDQDSYLTGKNRRNGINLDSNSEDDDFLTDLLEFKKNYKRQKKSPGLRFARSVENLLKIDKPSNPIRNRSNTDTKETKGLGKKRVTFLKRKLFHKTGKSMDDLRETSLLDDDDDYYYNSHKQPSISLIEDSVQKVAGIIEMYVDKQGDVIRKIEIRKVPGQSLGFFIRFGDGIERKDGIFISRVTLGSFVDVNNLLHAGDEIIYINKVDVTGHTLEEVASMMQKSDSLVIKTRSALPLPLNAQPLLKSYDIYNDYVDEHETRDTELLRTKSDPADIQYRVDSIKRDRSRTTTNPNDAKMRPTLTRAKNMSQNDMLSNRNLRAVLKSPTFQRKLPSIPSGKIADTTDDSFNVKRLSRAQKYLQKPASLEQDLNNNLSKSPRSGFIKSPKFFRKADNKKNEHTGSLLSIPSNDSLSSTSDSEESKSPTSILKTQVYTSDSTSRNAKFTKGFSGKLSVHVMKMFGRLSALDGECYCTIEVDDEYKATTQPKKLKDVIEFDENFDIDIRSSCVLMFYIFHKLPRKQHKLLSQSCIHLEKLLDGQKKAQLLLSTTNHVQLRLCIEFTEARSYLQRSPSSRSSGVFGFNLSRTLVQEENTVPIIVRKCVEEIEKRGLDLVGIYRISGNARKKKILRSQFEENSLNTDVDDIDCHVIAGILKDYLRELPNPLISQETYLNIYNKSLEVQNNTDAKSRDTVLVELMKKLPHTNRATLIYIMEHLQSVAQRSDENKMDFKNLAVCFGPTMMCPPITKASSSADMFDFKKQIQALEFLLSIWPKNAEQNRV